MVTVYSSAVCELHTHIFLYNSNINNNEHKEEPSILDIRLTTIHTLLHNVRE